MICHMWEVDLFRNGFLSCFRCLVLGARNQLQNSLFSSLTKKLLKNFPFNEVYFSVEIIFHKIFFEILFDFVLWCRNVIRHLSKNEFCCSKIAINNNCRKPLLQVFCGGEIINSGKARFLRVTSSRSQSLLACWIWRINHNKAEILLTSGGTWALNWCLRYFV